jgi:hypothetical protein
LARRTCGGWPGNGTEQITRDLLDLVPVDHAAERAASRRPGRRGQAKATA